jgi:hypothetical protein
MALVLVGCEESQAVCIAFREKGHEAYSCDIIPCSGGHPEWHLQMDVFEAIKLKKWDMMIAFPPCTYLSSVQTFICRKNPERVIKRIEAAMFFMKLYNSEIPRIALENPTGVMSHIFRPADQVIHPYYFGDDRFKRTCLWLSNLPILNHSPSVDLFNNKTHKKPKDYKYSYVQKSTGKTKYVRDVNTPFLSSLERSKLSPYIAAAMADQWSPLLK